MFMSIKKNFVAVALEPDTENCFVLAVFENGEFSQIETPKLNRAGELTAWWFDSPFLTGKFWIEKKEYFREFVLRKTGVDICANGHSIGEQWYTGFSPEVGHHTRTACVWCGHEESHNLQEN
jgi:hypothetical protein